MTQIDEAQQRLDEAVADRDAIRAELAALMADPGPGDLAAADPGQLREAMRARAAQTQARQIEAAALQATLTELDRRVNQAAVELRAAQSDQVAAERAALQSGAWELARQAASCLENACIAIDGLDELRRRHGIAAMFNGGHRAGFRLLIDQYNRLRPRTAQERTAADLARYRALIAENESA